MNLTEQQIDELNTARARFKEERAKVLAWFKSQTSFVSMGDAPSWSDYKEAETKVMSIVFKGTVDEKKESQVDAE